MSDKSAAEKQPLDEIMLAMDVVDTLRHREHIVERELHNEERDEKLLKRLREIYASQGMEVPDHVLKEGVAALREERFSYQPPPDSLSVTLARIYIERGKWAKRASVTLGALLVAWLSWSFFVTGPAREELRNQVAELNREISATSGQLALLEERLQRAENELPAAARGIPGSLQKAATIRTSAAEKSLRQAHQLLESARRFTPPTSLDTGNFAARSEEATIQLGNQQEQIAQIGAAIGSAEKSLAEIDSLKVLPDQLASSRDAVIAVAREDQATGMASEIHDRGISSLAAGDVELAIASAAELRELHDTLEQEYELRIVSRPGERSGVWRIPEHNPSARNYYVIVEAIGPGGEVLPQSVTSEEDGSATRVRQWGMRVDERVFNRIRDDKQDDGIIQNRRFGEKRRGYLSIDYSIPTTGAAITSW